MGRRITPDENDIFKTNSQDNEDYQALQHLKLPEACPALLHDILVGRRYKLQTLIIFDQAYRLLTAMGSHTARNPVEMELNMVGGNQRWQRTWQSTLPEFLQILSIRSCRLSLCTVLCIRLSQRVRLRARARSPGQSRVPAHAESLRGLSSLLITASQPPLRRLSADPLQTRCHSCTLELN
eukprot:s1030_g12.t1